MAPQDSGKALRQSRRSWHRTTISLCLWQTACIWFVCWARPVSPEVIYRVDPLALLAATLRTYQRAGCDSEQLSLSCPRGTSISIELAQYGRAGDLSDHSLCPPVSREDLSTPVGNGGDSVIHSGTQIEVKPPETCTVSRLQYALLQTVVDACQKRRHCKFSANAKPLPAMDPCSGIRKFVEIAYKCRPYEFRSKVACENDTMPLVCNPYSRIAVYSASFGHVDSESIQCPHNGSRNGSEEVGKPTCVVSYATETVMQICHGRRRCSITADAGTFGHPCTDNVLMHLKVVYTCIPRKVLKDRYETAPELDEPQQSDVDVDQDELYDEDQFDKEGEAIPPIPKLQGTIPKAAYPYGFNGPADEATTTPMGPVASRNDNSLEENQEQFYLYLVVSVAAGVLLCLTLVIGRLTLQRRRSPSRKGSLSSGSNVEKNTSDKAGGDGDVLHDTQLNSCLADDSSDVDADLDLTSPIPVKVTLGQPARNEAFLKYAPIPNCAYSSLTGHSSANYSPSAAFMPTSQYNGRLVAGLGISDQPLTTSAATGSRQATPPPATLYASLGACSPSVSGSLQMGAHLVGPSVLSPAANQIVGAPSYLSGTMMTPGHHHPHTGTLRRSLMPTSLGIVARDNTAPHPLVGIPTSSSVYYDTTMPRHLGHGLSTDSPQYFYG